MTFETVYREHYATIYRFCHRLTGSPEEARDLTQETFMRFYTAVQHSQPIDQPAAWLYRVAGNMCITSLRQNRRRAELLDQNRDCLPSETTTEPDFMHREAIRKIRQALDRLSPRDQVLINLYQERRSYTEIAEIIGVQPGSVGTLLSRAIAQLRSLETTGAKR
jgi:RNA polymerase sigma-70 factor (ECF subfamily)